MVFVPQERLELSTEALGVLYSIHLSYWGMFIAIIAFLDLFIKPSFKSDCQTWGGQAWQPQGRVTALSSSKAPYLLTIILVPDYNIDENCQNFVKFD